jgi:CBS domain-containing protein
MARNIVECRTDDDIDVALRLMCERGLRRLPVVDEAGRLRGIISLDDLASEA